jgi:uroporphyrinogen III methyltransferase / synthase
MDDVRHAQNSSLVTVLISSEAAHGGCGSELKRRGARLLTWPPLKAAETENHDAIDEAIESLFGYDWLIFRNRLAASFFLDRFNHLGHEASELDTLRVCAADEETAGNLEASKIHVDVIPDAPTSPAIVDAIEAYVGGREATRGLNLLVPAAGGELKLLRQLEDAGARVDLITAYRSSATNETSRMTALLRGGGIDWIAFRNAAELREFAEVFDTNDLDALLSGMSVGCVGQATIELAIRFGLRSRVSVESENAIDLLQAMVSQFGP